MQADFLKSLDDFFCDKYVNYGRLAAIAGYERPLGATDGERFKLSKQPKREELLARFKEGLVDRDFSFTFEPLTLKQKLRDLKRTYTFKRNLPFLFRKYSLDEKTFYKEIDMSEEVWRNIVKGKFYPTKNAIFAMALAGGFSHKDTATVLSSCMLSFDYESVRDVVVDYLLSYRVFNRGLIDEALKEYGVSCLPLRKRDSDAEGSEEAEEKETV